jgi:hypothetical protein
LGSRQNLGIVVQNGVFDLSAGVGVQGMSHILRGAGLATSAGHTHKKSMVALQDLEAMDHKAIIDRDTGISLQVGLCSIQNMYPHFRDIQHDESRPFLGRALKV